MTRRKRNNNNSSGADKPSSKNQTAKPKASPRACAPTSRTPSQAKNAQAPTKPAASSRASAPKARTPSQSSNTPSVRTKSGKVPQGRTLSTYDYYLDKNTSSKKERPLVVIEANDNDELACTQLTTTKGKDRTKLPHYQQGQSYYKHYVEIEDDEGQPIKINRKFRENRPEMDISKEDVKNIRDRLFKDSKHKEDNQKKIGIFRSRKKPRD